MSSDNWQKIKECLTIPDLLTRMHVVVEFKRNKGLCPIHVERTPSFNIYDRGTRFKCYGCGAGGDVGDCYCALANCDSKQAYRDLCGMLNLDPQEGVTGLYERPTPRRVVSTVTTKTDKRTLCDKFVGFKELTLWMSKKGISEAVFREMIMDGDLTIECGKLVFIYNTGRKERGDWNSSRGNRWIAGGAEGALWRIQDVRNFDHRTIIMCEGESDAMRVLTEIRGRDHGVGVVAIPSASWVPDEAMANLIGRNRNVVLMFDHDAAGLKAKAVVGQVLGAVSGCKVYEMAYVPEHKDVCEMPQEMLRNELDKVLTLN